LHWLDDRLPKGVGEIKDPKKAASAMIEANRSEVHRKYYEIGFRDDEALPKMEVVAFLLWFFKFLVVTPCHSRVW